MAKLVSMKIDAKAREKKYEESALVDRPEYPWGLQLRLDEEAIAKLGIDLPEVGKDLMIVARVNVTSVSSHDSATGGKNRGIELQITDMCLEADTGEGGAAADKLYGGK